MSQEEREDLTWNPQRILTAANLGAKFSTDQLKAIAYCWQRDHLVLVSVREWLHAAYDRPPQTPECRAMLAEVDALTEAVLAGLRAVYRTSQR